MTIHKEGYRIIVAAALLIIGINILSFIFLSAYFSFIVTALFILSLLLFLFLVSFFRIPKRSLTVHEDKIICPADGKVVVIEEVMEEEYFKDKRLQVSIFMSPANVHVNRNAITGIVKYCQYYKGKYLVAWHPKSSLENERYSVVVENGKGAILIKQIAGALAKRICNYLTVGQQVTQGEEMGFIKFGSRVDVLLPLNCKINVQLNEAVKGGVTTLATW
jgi:phosphatidylserine decarboxylase